MRKINCAVKIIFFTLFLSVLSSFSIPELIVLPNISFQSCYMNSVLQILLRNKDLNDMLLANERVFKDSPIKDYIDFYKELDKQSGDEIYVENNQNLYVLLETFFEKHRTYFNEKDQQKLYIKKGGTSYDFYSDFLTEIKDRFNSAGEIKLEEIIQELLFVDTNNSRGRKKSLPVLTTNNRIFIDKQTINNDRFITYLPKYFAVNPVVIKEKAFKLYDFSPADVFKTKLSEEGKEIKYDLKGIVVFSGNHYWSYVENGNKWYKWNDLARKKIDKILPTDINNIVDNLSEQSSNVNLLYYERQEKPKTIERKRKPVAADEPGAEKKQKIDKYSWYEWFWSWLATKK